MSIKGTKNILNSRINGLDDYNSNSLKAEYYKKDFTTKGKKILDKKIKVIKTNRGGKITWHGKGQLVCYFVINLNKRNKDIRKFITNLSSILKRAVLKS